jgi:hypothetical protein
MMEPQKSQHKMQPRWSTIILAIIAVYAIQLESMYYFFIRR